MDVRDVGTAQWRRLWSTGLRLLVVSGGTVAAGIAFAPESYAAPATPSAAEGPGVAVSVLLASRLLIVLGFLALLVLAALAFWQARRLHAVGDAAAIEEAAAAPLLAHLDQPADLTTMPALAPGTTGAGAFRHVQLALAASAQAGSSRVVVAGLSGGDLNAWLGANCALSLAGSGRRVLLVDGRIGARFGTPGEDAPDTPGLYDVLRGADLDSAVSPGPVDLLQVLPAGSNGQGSVGDLLSRRFQDVMSSAAEYFDDVVVIGPPLDVSADSRTMAVGGSIVLAVAEGSDSTSALRMHAELVRAAGAELLGVVLLGRADERAAA